MIEGVEVEVVARFACPKCGHENEAEGAVALEEIACIRCLTRVRAPARVGTMLLTDRLGEGTAAWVFRAFDRVLGRDVAVKMTKPAAASLRGPQTGSDEAHALMRLRHRHVVEVYALVNWHGCDCVVMELLTGGSVRERLEAEDAMEEAAALRIARDAAAGLAEACRNGLLHLDVKPGNIMFDREGTAKLVDFGFGAIDESERAGETLGSAPYVSPELVRRQVPDHRSDIYSLGASLFHMVCGTIPFGGRTQREVVRGRLMRPAPSPQEHNPLLSERAERLIRRMMAQDPADRPCGYEELVEGFDEALGRTAG